MPIRSLRDLQTISIARSQLVEQNKTVVKFYTAEQSLDIRLYAEGLNPCIGIAFYGEVHFADADGNLEKSWFIILNHNQGLPVGISNDNNLRPTKIKNFCEETIANILSEVENATEQVIYSLQIKRAYSVRCQQQDLTNPQESLAQELQSLLQNKTRLLTCLEDYLALTAEVSLAEDYDFSAIVELEQIINNESDAIHFILQANSKTSPDRYFRKSFLTMADAIARKLSWDSDAPAITTPASPTTVLAINANIVNTHLGERMTAPADEKQHSPALAAAASPHFGKKDIHQDALINHGLEIIDKENIASFEPNVTPQISPSVAGMRSRR